MRTHHLHHQLQEAGWKQLHALQQSSNFAELLRGTKKNLGRLGFYHLRLIPRKLSLAATRANISPASNIDFQHELHNQ
jgi:hypothetical protein